MDYKVAALKVTCSQLKEAIETTSQKKGVSTASLGGILFQRAWVQGLLVWTSDAAAGDLLLDDGTAVLLLSLSPELRRLTRRWTPGMYVMVVGAYVIRTGEQPSLKVHKIVDLSEFPDREAMWYLEVIEAYKLFYEPLIEEFM